MAGINTAFNVGRGRSWGPEPRGPQGASLSSSLARSNRLAGAYVYLSLFPVIARDPTPQPPPAEGSLLFLRSAIRQIAIDTGDPLFLFFFSSLFSPCLLLPPPLARIAAPLRSSAPAPPPLPPFKSSAKAKGKFFHLGSRDNAHSILPRAFFIYLVLFSESLVRHALDRRRRRLSDRAADNADRYRRVRTCGDFRGFAQRDDGAG